MDQIVHDDAVRSSEQGVILAGGHIQTGLDLGAALAYENITGKNKLARVALDAQTLGI
jgi:hypothetical protein